MTTHGKSRLKVPGATALLRANHKKVADLFAGDAAARSPAPTKLVAQACIELSVRAQGDVEVPRSHVRRHVKEDQNEWFFPGHRDTPRHGRARCRVGGSQG